MPARLPLLHRQRSWADQQSFFAYRLTYLLVGWLFRLFDGRVHAIRPQCLPSRGAAFVIANHTSGMDPFIVGFSMRHRIARGPGKVELFKNPLIGYVMRRIGIFPLDRARRDAAAVRTMVELYRHGEVVIVFPEGGRSRDGRLRPFDEDLTRLLLRIGAYVVPAGVAGAPDFLPVGSLRPNRHVRLVVAYGEPVNLSDYQRGSLNEELIRDVTDDLRRRVSNLATEAEAYRQTCQRTIP